MRWTSTNARDANRMLRNYYTRALADTISYTAHGAVAWDGAVPLYNKLDNFYYSSFKIPLRSSSERTHNRSSVRYRFESKHTMNVRKHFAVKTNENDFARKPRKLLISHRTICLFFFIFVCNSLRSDRVSSPSLFFTYIPQALLIIFPIIPCPLQFFSTIISPIPLAISSTIFFLSSCVNHLHLFSFLFSRYLNYHLYVLSTIQYYFDTPHIRFNFLKVRFYFFFFCCAKRSDPYTIASLGRTI